MRYSKQFVNTYTVAFMIIYFFTLFGFRLSNIFGNALVGTIELVYKFIFQGLLSASIVHDLTSANFDAEFRIACALTSLVAFLQLCASIRNFHNDLIKLHKGDKFFHSDPSRYSNKEYSNLIKRRIKDSSTIASDSLHFPGYLVAHLVYGYVILFVGFFACIIVTKLLIHVNGFWQTSAQILMPLFILFAFKFVIIKFLIKSVFLKNDKQRITNLAPYFMLSYFNFFFDCFLGLVACMSRVWQTTFISLIRLPRLDKSMFNSENDILLKRLDKGHLAYINYVRMEHWYNNPVLNGFCEMLIESMFYSQVYKGKFDAMAKTSFSIRKNSVNSTDPISAAAAAANYDDATGSDLELNIYANISNTTGTVKKVSSAGASHSKITMRQMISQTSSYKEYNVVERLIEIVPTPKTAPSRYMQPQQQQRNIFVLGDGGGGGEEDKAARRPTTTTPTPTGGLKGRHVIKEENADFNYKSFLRLRNLICLCLLLRKNPSLAKYRMHYLLKVKEEEEKLEKFRVQTFAEFYNQTINKHFETFKRKLKFTGGGGGGGASGASKTHKRQASN